MFLTNDWVIWFYNNYSMAIVGVPAVIVFLLKLVAIIRPTVPTNKIIDLIKDSWPIKVK